MITEKLASIQQELKAPKDLKNEFGGFSYRSAEQIESQVKPLLEKYKAILTLNDEIVFIGERHYIKATATLIDYENRNDTVSTCAYAREQESKKGMDEAQVTGACSSYARKCALCGLFLIDDSKDDPDTKDNTEVTPKVPITDKQLEFITEHNSLVIKELKELNIKSANQLKKLSIEQASKLVEVIEEKLQKNG